MSKIRVNQLETLDGTNTVDVAGIVDDINTAEVTTSTGTQALDEALDSRATVQQLSKRVLQVASVADMLALDTTGLTDGEQVSVRGYYVGSDVGGGLLYWDALSTEADNGGTVFEADGVTTGRWIRILPSLDEICASQFGLSESVDLSDVLNRAISFALSAGIKKITIDGSGSYNFSGGVIVDIQSKDLEIGGASGTFSPTINHTGDNIGITFKNSTSLLNRGRLSNLRVVGNAGANASFAEFSDSWGCEVESIYVSGYSALGAFVLHNYAMWTENFTAKKIMSRGNKSLFRFKRTAIQGGTNSYYGFTAENCWHQFAVPSSTAIDVSESSGSGDPIVLYGSKIDVGGWFETGGGHNYVLVDNGCRFVDSSVIFRSDGFGGLTSGADMRLIRVLDGGFCDVSAVSLSQQGQPVDLSATPSGEIRTIEHLVSQINPFSHTSSAEPLARAQGAKMKFLASAVTDDRVFVISRLPAFSQWRVSVSFFTTDYEFKEVYLISVGSQNFAAKVYNQSAAARQTPNMTIRAYLNNNAGNGGSFAVDGGSRFEWVINAATHGNSVTSTLEVEML